MTVAMILKNKMIQKERRKKGWAGLSWIEHMYRREDEMLLKSGDFNLLRFANFRGRSERFDVVVSGSRIIIRIFIEIVEGS